VSEAQGNQSAALASYQAYRDIMLRLVQLDPGNAAWQYDLAYSYHRLGGLALAGNQLTAASENFDAGRAIIMRLTAKDPRNTRWQWELAILDDALAKVSLVWGDLAAALVAFQAAREIMARLVELDPANIGWQQDLSAASMNIGVVLAGQGRLQEALQSYRDVLVVLDRLAAIDRSFVQPPKDRQLAVDRIGTLAYRLVLVHDFSSALDAVDRAIALAPDKIWLYGNRAHALMFLGREDEARAIYLRFHGTRNAMGEKSWDAMVLEDFAELRKAGLAHPLMDEIEKQLAGG
jgi:tetratricopeptide (TPR) repeat protein